MERRGSGILLHITSLPSPYGIGDMGTGAYRFVDFLAEAKQNFWQILPLNSTCSAYGNSPYSSYSAFAGNLLLISPELMVKDSILLKSDIKGHPTFPKEKVHYSSVSKYKEKILGMAYEKNKDKIAKNHEFKRFCNENSLWLDDYSLFVSIKGYFSKVDWNKWPEDLRDRKKDALKEWKKKLSEKILMAKFLQYIFFKQWYSLKNYCSSKNVQIIGDVPIYVNYNSADVWVNPKFFCLDRRKRPVFVSGVPPDYFSSTGQLWGHPVYKWEVLKKNQYSWWIKRIRHNLKLFHISRLDHFRGFVGYWEIRANEKTAINGKWVKAPAREFFDTLFKHFPHFPVIVEDLGAIAPDVREIINLYGFTGMKVLLFAFGKNLPSSTNAPHNHIKNCVVYTGTHDNNTIKGWFKKEIGSKGRKRLSEYVGRKVTEKTVHRELISLAMRSVADMAIIPMQDILGLGEKARMNRPATTKGNWQWRVTSAQLSRLIAKRLAGMTMIYGRNN